MVSDNNGSELKIGNLSGNHMAIGAVAIFVFAILTLVATSGMINIPLLTEILGTGKPVYMGVENGNLNFKGDFPGPLNPQMPDQHLF